MVRPKAEKIIHFVGGSWPPVYENFNMYTTQDFFLIQSVTGLDGSGRWLGRARTWRDFRWWIWLREKQSVTHLQDTEISAHKKLTLVPSRNPRTTPTFLSAVDWCFYPPSMTTSNCLQEWTIQAETRSGHNRIMFQHSQLKPMNTTATLANVALDEFKKDPSRWEVWMYRLLKKRRRKRLWYVAPTHF